jgi:hypothetical protein
MAKWDRLIEQFCGRFVFSHITPAETRDEANRKSNMDMKDQIVGWVHRIDHLRNETEKHWSNIQKSIAAGRVDDAISLLNAYFGLKQELIAVEAKLEGMLHSYFSEK